MKRPNMTKLLPASLALAAASVAVVVILELVPR